MTRIRFLLLHFLLTVETLYCLVALLTKIKQPLKSAPCDDIELKHAFVLWRTLVHTLVETEHEKLLQRVSKKISKK